MTKPKQSESMRGEMKIPTDASRNIEIANQLIKDAEAVGFDLGSVEAKYYAKAAALYSAAIIIILKEHFI